MNDSENNEASSWDEFFTRFSRKDVPDGFLTEADRNQGNNIDREVFEKASMPRIGALADAWESVASVVLSPTGLAGMQLHDAREAVQGAIAAYIAATKDTRLLTLLYLLGYVERKPE